jgi:hypothetical protein
MPVPLPTPEVALPLLLAGDCRFTIVSRRTQVRHTFRVTEAPVKPQYAARGPAWFVKALIGPDNGSDYAYIGMLRAPAAGVVPTFGLTSGSRATPDDARVKGLQWLFGAMRQYDTNPSAVAAWEQVEVWHSDTCARCGLALTDPSSIAARLGPECYQHVHGCRRPTVAPPVAVEAAPAAPAEPAPAVEAPAPRKGRAKAAKATPTPAPAVEVVPVEAPAAHPMRGPSGFLF